MTDEDIEKIAKKILELQTKDGIKAVRSPNMIAEVTGKYHQKLWEKFGGTGTIEQAVRTVAIYSQGQRYISSLNGDELQRAKEFAEYLYKKILGIEE